jgi:hypothetical protein
MQHRNKMQPYRRGSDVGERAFGPTLLKFGAPISGRRGHVSDDNSEFHRLLKAESFDPRTATWGPSLAAPITDVLRQY